MSEKSVQAQATQERIFNLRQLVKKGDDWEIGEHVGVVVVRPGDIESQSGHIDLLNTDYERLTTALSVGNHSGAIVINCNLSPGDCGDLECVCQTRYYALTPKCECFLKENS